MDSTDKRVKTGNSSPGWQFEYPLHWNEKELLT